MRIISKFKDYYDSCMGLGVDKELVYVRNPVESYTNINEYPNQHDFGDGNYLRNKDQSTSYASGIVGFCGRAYPYVVFRKSIGLLGDSEIVYCYSAEQFLEYLSRPGNEQYIAAGYRNFRTLGGSLINPEENKWDRYATMANYKKFFAERPVNHEPFFKHKVPVFHLIINDKYDGNVISPYKLTLNPCLKDLQFFRALDTFTAYQELSMYLGGVLPRTGHDMVILSDIEKRDKQGFDDMSFKTYSPGKKHNRRNK